MEHPDDEKLVRYISRQIAAAEMVAVILHLESCHECASKVQNLSAAENRRQILLMENDSMVFHLDYDEHLHPFVDQEADAATREIVETHVQDCGACAFELRELRQFAESLRLREIEKSQETGVSILRRVMLLFSNLSHNRVLPIAAGVLILLLTTAIWLLIRKNQTSSDSEISKLSNNVSESPASIVTNPTPEVQPFNENSIVAKIKKYKAPKHRPVNTREFPEKTDSNAFSSKNIEFDELDELPDRFRENIRSAMSSGRITVPAKLNEIAALIKPRGGSDDKLAEISPDREIVRESKPKFSWKGNALEGKSYVIEIFNDKNDSVAISPPLNKNSWKPEKALEAGKTYKWELRTKSADEPSEKTVAVGQFSVLDLDGQTAIKDLKSASALNRGIIFASLGLIKEARREFRKAAKNSSKSPARKFLRQLEKFP